MRNVTNLPAPIAVVLTLCLLLVACGNGDDAPETPDADDGATDDDVAAPADDGAQDDTLVISDSTFSGVTVSGGATVEVVNNDGIPHTATAVDGEFDSGTVDGGATVSFTAPDEPGTYDFACTIHPQMQGSLTVT